MKDPLRGLPQGSSKDGLQKGSTGTVTLNDIEDDKEKDSEVPPEVPTTGNRRNMCADDLHRARVKMMKKKRIWINLTNCKQSSVRRAAIQFGLKEVGDDEEWTLFWTDYSVSLDKAMELKRYQKINHFPGMNEICRKDLLARNLNRMLKLYPKDYNIFPKTWCLPSDYHEFMAYSRARKSKTFICKPDSECQGRGIFLTRNTSEVKPGEDMVCQVYIPKEDICMHLTNYSINKHSKNFVRDENKGSKRKLSFFNKYMENNAYDLERLWSSIEDVIIKTILAAYPVLKHNYLTCFPNHISGSACFEILGFDILLDQSLKPWLLEVNHSPSFTTDSKLDQEVKDNLLYDTFCMINLGACDRRKVLEEERRRTNERLLHIYKSREDRADEIKSNQAAWVEQMEKYEDENMGNFRRIYPIPGTEKYDKFLKYKHSLFQETIASKAREECARQMRQEIRQKQEQKELLLKGRKYPERNLRGESQNQKNLSLTALMKQKPPTPPPPIATSPVPETERCPIQGMSEIENVNVEKTEETPPDSTDVDPGLNVMEQVDTLCAATMDSPDRTPENNSHIQTQAKDLDQTLDQLEILVKSETEAITEPQPEAQSETPQEVEMEPRAQSESQPEGHAQPMAPEETQSKAWSEAMVQIQAAVQQQVQHEAQDQDQTEDLGQAQVVPLNQAHGEAEDQVEAETCNQTETKVQDPIQLQASDQAHREAPEQVQPETWHQVQPDNWDQAQEAQGHVQQEAQDQVQTKDQDPEQAQPQALDPVLSEVWDQAQQEAQDQAQTEAWDQAQPLAQVHFEPEAQTAIQPKAETWQSETHDEEQELMSDAESQTEAYVEPEDQAESQFQMENKLDTEIKEEAQQWIEFVPNPSMEIASCNTQLEIPEELDTQSTSSQGSEEELRPKDTYSITSVKSMEQIGSSSQFQLQAQVHPNIQYPPTYQLQFPNQNQPETQVFPKVGLKARKGFVGNHYFTSQMIKRVSMALKRNRNQVCPPNDVNYFVQTDTTEALNQSPYMMEEIPNAARDQHNSNCSCWKRNANRIFCMGRLRSNDVKSCFTNHCELQRNQVTETFHSTFVNPEKVIEDKSRRNLCVVSFKAPTIQRLGCAHFTKPTIRQKDLNNIGRR
ncbi:tubulin polyglutamylase ttll6-like isoform X2 [Chiloscyllium plagiosum]|uniref:tubulin polyglutamylase ttll6-like isoform X2 n=1 Tax=Chiloscyllium plagiosum TaxID=36176 RepID=UPI001CB7CCCD|nr:tubulin polyglutamylase ttll6-like isoform X2 [Chiloscyllium plagiosum]